MAYKNRTAGIIYENMLKTTANEVAESSMLVMDKLQTKKPSTQILALGALMVILLGRYGINATDVLNMAQNMVFNKNSKSYLDFKAIKQFMKDEWSN